MRKNDIEKSLKRFLKRKVSYSLSLLITFMITGGISLGAGITAEEIQEIKSDLLTRIQTEREEIKRKIEENEKLIKEYNSDLVEFVRKGDFYSKPSIPSTQVFFSYQNLDNGKMKDRTEKEFKKTLNANKSNSIDLEKTNGVIINNEKYVITIDTGANIKPIQIKLPSIKPEVEVGAPQISVDVGELSTLPSINMPIFDIDAPTLAITSPLVQNVNIPVVVPAGEVGAVTKPEEPKISEIKDINVVIGTPALSEGFSPIQIAEPVPVSKLDNITFAKPQIFISSLVGMYEGNVAKDEGWFWKNIIPGQKADNALISEPIVTNGELTITLKDTDDPGSAKYFDGYDAEIKNYDAYFAGNTYTDPSEGATITGKTFTQSVNGKAGLEIIGVVGSRYTSFGPKTTITLDGTNREGKEGFLRTVIGIRPYGNSSASKIAEIVEATQEQRDEANKLVNKFATAFVNDFNDSGYQILALSGTITMKGNRLALVSIQSLNRTQKGRNMILLHEGTTTLTGEQNAVFLFPNGMGGPTDVRVEAISNTGKIAITGKNNSAVTIDRENSNKNLKTNFFNKGENADITLSGYQNTGIFIKNNIFDGLIQLEKPIRILDGQYNAGISIKSYNSNNQLNQDSVIKVDIEGGEDNVGLSFMKSVNSALHTQIINSNIYNISGGKRNIAVWATIERNKNQDLALNGLDIKITGGEQNYGVFTRDYSFQNETGKVFLDGKITITGGTGGHIGVINGGSSEITHTGEILITNNVNNNVGVLVTGGEAKKDSTTKIATIKIDSGTNNTALMVQKDYEGKSKVEVDNISVSNVKDSQIIVGGTESDIKVKNKVNINVSATDTADTKLNAGAVYASEGAKIDISTTEVLTAPNIEITGKKSANGNIRGYGVTATDGGIINLDGNYIKVIAGVSTISSFGATSKIEAKNAKIEYKGEGYAVYSDGEGTVDISGSTLILDGKAVAFKMDKTIGVVNPITATGTKYHVKSNDVVVFNLQNLQVPLSTANLKVDIENLVSSNGITADAGITKYKLAAVDGGTINVGNLNKGGATGEYFYDNFLGQRLKLKANNSTITAILTNDQAKEYRDQVVGLEISSSKLATKNDETTISLQNSHIVADRNGNGAGAIGAFLNYGIISVDVTSTINVEKEIGNTVNDKAVGIYAVNGSNVFNKGTITVGGNSSIGILGMAYREDKNGIIKDEFGTKAINQGIIRIENAKTIALEGKGSIGIYASNNNDTSPNSASNVTNSGTITVGDSDTLNPTDIKSAIGIYGKKSKIHNAGTIIVGEKAVGIYAIEHSAVTGLGSLTIGQNGIGVIIDKGSTLAANTITLSATAGTTGQVGIYYDGNSTGAAKTTSINIDTSSLKEAIAIYAKDTEIISTGTLNLGEKGIGIIADGKKGTNNGTIDLDLTNAVGMYTKNSEIINEITKDITLKGATQIGMYAIGDTAKVTNEGTIKFEGSNESIGIYLKDGATTIIDLANNITFIFGSSNIGIYADKSDITFDNSLTFASNNENNNIYAYVKGGRISINVGEKLTIDGVTIPAIPNENNKTIGVYISNGSSITGEVDVKNGAIGIYSSGNNNLGLSLVVDSAGTIGAFVDGESLVSGSVTATNGAIGIYGSEGKVTIDNAGLDLKTPNGNGTGMYLTDGAYATGGEIRVNNSGVVNNIGVYYNKGTSNSTVKNDVTINLIGNNSIGIYAANGITLFNKKDIASNAVNSNIATFVSENSILISAGNITMSGTNDIGIYVNLGQAYNRGTIDVAGASGVTTTGSIGMVANSNGTLALISNEGNSKIIAGPNLGMYIAGNSSGTNVGEIIATTGSGVYVNGSNAEFNGNRGTISVGTGTGILLKDTSAGMIKVGTLNIGTVGIGVYGNNSVIDFVVDTSTSNGATSVVAKGGTISGEIKAGNESIGLYLTDDTAAVNGVKITTGTGKKSIGVYLNTAGNFILTNSNIDAKDGAGIYLEKSSSVGAGVKTLTYSGTITTIGGTGIFIGSGNTLNAGTSTFNVNGGIGVYLTSGATANLGQASNNTTFNLNGGTAIYNDGGTLNLGSNIDIKGNGSLVAITNGDITSSANFNVGKDAQGFLGVYNNAITAGVSKSIINKGTITAQDGGVAIAAIKKVNTSPTGDIKVINDTDGILDISGKDGDKSSVGIYTDIAKVENKGKIVVGTDGVGIFVDASGKDILSTGVITMTGTDGIGVSAKGSIDNLALNGITSITSKNTGIVLNEITVGGTASLGTIVLGDESVGMYVIAGNSINSTGSISVGNSSNVKSSIGVIAKGATIDLSGITNITAGIGGIGVHANTSIISNIDLAKITVGANGSQLYSIDSTINNISGSISANNNVGVYAEKGIISGTIGNITVANGGTGLYLEEIDPTALNLNNITVQSGRADKYSIGVYYKDMANVGTLYGMSQSGNYTIGSILYNTTGTVGPLNLTFASNSVGIALKVNSNLTANNLTVSGNKNIGIHSLDSKLTINGNINVLDSSYSNDKSLSSIGVYSKNGSIVSTGNVIAGNNSIGVYGESVNSVSVTGNSTVGSNGLGVYASGKIGGATLQVGTTGGSHTIAADNAIGVFGENINTTVKGDFTIGNGTSIGVVSKGNGNVNTTGDMTIGESSIGIYKIGGPGDIAVGVGTFTVDKKGYGIYATEISGTITNNADMMLKESSIGIYLKGTNTLENTGTITAGKTNFGVDNSPGTTEDNINSVGIFMSGGTTAKNNGTINVTEALSVGVYSGEAGNKFINNGTMNVDNGGIGVIVKGGSTAENNGVINLGGTINSAGESIGMAAYMGSTILNSSLGTINVTEGIGMYVATGATLKNEGTLNIVNGTGILGDGQIFNSGTVSILQGGNGTTISTGIVTSTGGIKIDKDGKVTINDKYHSIGGTLKVDGTLDINGAFVDITTGKPVFEADSITGEINILPNFALTGNGFTYEIKDFLNVVNNNLSGGKITTNLSPLWVADIDRDGNLIIVKKPYADITVGNQFDNLDKGLDNILMGNGSTEDIDILKNVNHYLSGLSEEDYKEEAGKMLGETRGDIYSTIQGRMQDINRAFDNSFYELETSYNLTKDSSKYSVIYTDGNYKDPTVGIDNYDYKITGVLYMKEKEGTEYGSKYGYTLGFTGSKFDFDDGGSKEDVYSLRVGAHRVKSLSDVNKVLWLSRIELGYNRHIAKRKLNLHETYENKGEYNTYSVAFDNRLTKVIYADLSRQLDVYADLDLEYGKVDGFTESGNLEVQIKDNDYLSAQLGAGVKVSQRVYVGDEISVKVTADVKYAYELGDNYDENKGRLKNGGKGYYSLITPEEREGKLTGKVGLTVEKANHMGVTFEVEAADEGNRKDTTVKYGMRFNYKF